MPDSAHPDSTSPGPRSAARVMDILLALSQAPDGLSLAAICQTLELPKTSTHSLLKALEQSGHVRRDAQGYSLGPESFRMAAAISQRRRFPELIRPIAEKLAKASGETVLVANLDENGVEIRYVDVLISKNALRFIVKIGDKRPLYSSTAGKILLAHFSNERLANYMSSVKRIPFTKKTLIRKSDLLDEIAKVRGQGWASNIDGTTEGITSFGAPIYEDDRSLLGAIVIAGPGYRMAKKTDELRDLALEAGREASRLLNCQQEYPPSTLEKIE